VIFSPSFWSIYFLLFKMNKTKHLKKKQKKVDSEEVLAYGIGLGWLGCERQNYLLRTGEVGRAGGRCLAARGQLARHRALADLAGTRPANLGASETAGAGLQAAKSAALRGVGDGKTPLAGWVGVLCPSARRRGFGRFPSRRSEASSLI